VITGGNEGNQAGEYRGRLSEIAFGRRLIVLIFALCWGLSLDGSTASETWRVRVEEPTGIYPRTNEIVSIPYDRIGGRQKGWRVVDAKGNEMPWQGTDTSLLFPVTLIPGELPEYRIAAAEDVKTNFASQIHLRKLGMSRIELGNRFFRVQVDTHSGAIVEAFNLSAEPYHVLNLVETTAEDPASLKDDIHAAEAMGFKPVEGVPEGNVGWTTLPESAAFTKVEFKETGPLRGSVLLGNANDQWELTWNAESRALIWQANHGFRFTAISASPYLPFDRCVEGSEYHWPNGPDDEEPPDHEIAPRPWSKLPGGHVVYYHHSENYGALGVVALDTNLIWTGVGSRRFLARGDASQATNHAFSKIAVTFPEWQASNTELEARREFRVLRQPVLVEASKAAPGRVSIERPAEIASEVAEETVSEKPIPFSPDAISLDGDWDLAWCEKGTGPPTNNWRKVKVPGSVHTEWLAPSQIYSRDAEWLSSKEWWYRRSFEVPERFAGRRLRLQFGATDYYADAWLNGTSLGRHEGYIDPYEYEVSSTAVSGATNELLVRTWAPVNYYWKHRSYTIKGAYGAVDQKPDDITPLGITRPVRLVASHTLGIRDLAIDTRLTDDGNAEVAVELELEGPAADSSNVELTLSPRNFSSDQSHRIQGLVRPGTNRLVIPVKNPQLWWTWDHGKPNLYTLDVKLRDESGAVVDGRSLAVGIREIERVGWTFYLNRRRMFIRGTNYYYHLYLSEMTRANYERDLGLMLQMNINLIRLHCHFSNPEFYDLADELGVLVWQDYLEAWYPEDRAFSLRAATLYDPLIRYARNHACIASWTTCDEESLENYRDLTKHLAPRPSLLDPQRRAIVRSTGRFGDAHVYHGWYNGTLWEYTKMTEPFVSELGATCLPNYDTLIKFMPDAWPIREHADEWFFRRLQIPEAMHAWGEPGELTLKEYIPRTQAYVSRLFQIALERSRRLKYQPAGGICHFHAIDIWPSVTMAAIDFDRVPTKVFYTVQRSFAPVCASLEYDQDRWKQGDGFRCGIWAINDNWSPVPDAAIQWKVLDSQGVEQASGHWQVSMAEDSVRNLGNAEWKTTGVGPHQLRAEVRGADGKLISENVFEFEVVE
jgi:beta-mannosidase